MTFKLRLLGSLVLALFLLLPAQRAVSQTGELRGIVFDPSGAAILGAQVTLAGAGVALRGESSADGLFDFHGLAPGVYLVSVAAKGFLPQIVSSIVVTAGRVREVKVSLKIAVEPEDVTISGQVRGLALNPDQNASAMVLSGSALNALSDDPDELRNELQALAGPVAGPSGGQIYINGFSGGQLPPKSSILEVRVNQNPFSAEFDRLGYGRVEIITKPGTQKLQGSLAAGGNDSVLNTAVPLVTVQPSYYQYALVGNLSGPLSKRASGFFSGYYVSRQNQAIVDALNPQNTSASIQEAVPQPIDYLLLNPRIDFQLGRNTFSIHDLFYRTRESGNGVGALSLASQSNNVISEENALQLSDEVLVSPQFVNETHFQWSRIYNDQVPANPAPTVIVEGAFSGGGSSAGILRDAQNNFDIQNDSTAIAGAHTLRFGTRLRLYDDSSYATTGANGTYTFNSIASYNAATPAPELYTVTQVNHPLASVLLFDGAFFFQDDWHWKPNFMVAAGLRLEGQNRIHDRADWAPRLAVAWSPARGSGAAQPRTVIRAGSGWFYNRFTVPSFFNSNSGTPYVLSTIHFNGANELAYVIENPDLYNPSATEPPSAFGSASSSIPTHLSLDPYFRTALDMQTGAGIDRQVTRTIMANVTYLYTRGIHQYLSNNVTAPAFDVATYTVTGPLPGSENYQFQSGGVYRQNQVIFTVNTQLKRLIVNANYMLNEAKSDTQGVFYFPSVPQDPGIDYGRATFGNRQRLTFIGSWSAPFGVSVSSLLVAQSGTPYDLTIGDDATENNQFNARPTYGTCGAAGVIPTRYGCLDTDPEGKSERMVPFGAGIGPPNAVVHIRLSKVIGVGPRVGTAQQGTSYQAGSSVSGRGLSGGSGSVRLDESAPRRYNLTFVVRAANLFNMVNMSPPNGVLLSPLFNQSQSIAPPPFQSATPGSRSFSFQTFFSF